MRNTEKEHRGRQTLLMNQESELPFLYQLKVFLVTLLGFALVVFFRGESHFLSFRVQLFYIWHREKTEREEGGEDMK